MKQDGLIRQEYEINCIAPLHTGSGEKLMSFEYLYDRKGQKVHFLDASKWVAFLAQKGLMDAFAAYLEQSGQNAKNARASKNLWDWLVGQGVKEAELRALARRTAGCVTLTAKGERNKLNDIVCQTVLADGNPYVPGSTIKGALRSGILYDAVQRTPERFRGVWRKIQAEKGFLGERQKSFQRLILSLEKEILHTLSLPGVRSEHVLSSALRGLRVSDAVCTSPAATVVLQKVDATTKAKRDGTHVSEIPLFRECIEAGTRLRFSVTADLAMLQTAGISSLDEVFHMLCSYTQDGLRRQEEAFRGIDRNYYQPLFDEARTADALLGGGTGFLTKTLIYALAAQDDEARAFIADYLDAAFMKRNKVTKKFEPAHHHMQHDHKLAPRTIKRAVLGQDDWLLGLCTMRRTDDAAAL